MRTERSVGCALWAALQWGGVAVLVAGCSQPATSMADWDASDGKLQIALPARGSSGSLYRLREAVFQIMEQPSGGYIVRSSEDDPLASQIEQTLAAGNYVIDLFETWRLERIDDGDVRPVVASLISPPTQRFTVRPNDETIVNYRFGTSGEVIDFGEGRLIIDIAVEEGAEGAGLAPALEIVNGQILGDNPHGIRATAFEAVLASDASLELTTDNGELCAVGSVGPAPEGEFLGQPEALFGLRFTSEAGAPEPWDLDAGRVVGFNFTVKGQLIPETFFGALPGSGEPGVDDYCIGFASSDGGSLTLPLVRLDRNCWLPQRAPLFAEDLQNIHWGIPGLADVRTDFDFCISDVRPLVQGAAR